jgi:hypothetical protein
VYAQLIEARLGPARLEALERLVRLELVPALRGEPGFCGALALNGSGRAEAVIAVFWETEAQAHRPLARRGASSGSAFEAVAELLASGSWSVTIWEVDARS